MASAVDTYSEALSALMVQLQKMKIIADANLPFLIDIETQVLQEIRSPERQMQAAGILPQDGQNPMAAGQGGIPGIGGSGGGPGMPPGGMPPGMAAPPPSFAGAGVPGMQTAPPSNPDALRRILTAGG